MNNFATPYRGAIALNNLAVVLQERQCGHQALETFSDALSLMKIASSRETADVSRKDVDDMIQRGFQRFANPSPSRQDIAMHFTSVSDDADFTAAMNAVSHGCHASNQGIMIRFEEYGAECQSERDEDLDSAVIVHNYGLSCLAMFQTHVHGSSQSNRCKTRRNALKLLQFSHIILSKRVSHQFDEDVESVITEKIFFVTLLVTKSMAQALFFAENKEWKVKECLEYLTKLKRLAHDLYVVDSQQSKKIAAAA